VQWAKPDEDRATCDIKDNILTFFLQPLKSYFIARFKETQRSLVSSRLKKNVLNLENPTKLNFVKKIKSLYVLTKVK
jgi:hypothetical protein